MATITEKKSKDGKLTGYKFSVAVDRVKEETGTDENGKKIYKYRQVWRTTSISRPTGLTPAKEEKAVKQMADAWESEIRAQYEMEKNGAVPTDVNSILLVDFIEDIWMKKHVKNGKHTPSTVSFFTYMGNDIKAYFTEKRPGLKLALISRLDVLDYLRWMQTEAKTKRGTPYGATTIQHHFSTLRNILEYARYIGYLKEDPATTLKPEDRPRRENKEIDFLDEDEAIKFISALESDKEKTFWDDDTNYLYWKALVNVLITTGLRRGELVGLQWGDFDKQNLLLHIRRNVTMDNSDKTEKDSEKKIHIGTTKGKEARIVPISQYLADLLTNLKTKQNERYNTLLPNAYIFCRSDAPYLPMFPTEPTRLLGKFNRRHGLRNVSPHDLRHTAASLAKVGGADMKDIQALLGHKDPAMTQRIYVGISLKTQRQTAEGIENILRPKVEKAKAE